MRPKDISVILAVICIDLATTGSALAQTWKSNNIVGNWSSLVTTLDGSRMAAASFISGISVSTNTGTSWQSYFPPDAEHSGVLAASTNGDALVAAFYSGGIYTSSDWGGSWVQSSAQVDRWNCLAASADGSKLLGGTSPGVIWSSADAGLTWTNLGAPYEFWQSIASSADGSNLLAASYSYMYRSTNAGVTWERLNLVFNTNAIINDLCFGTEVSTNASSHKANTNVLAGTNVFSTTLASTNGVIGDTLHVATTLAIDVTGTNVAPGTNVTTANVDLGITLAGTNLFDFGPVVTIPLGTNVGVVISTNTTRTSAHDLVISFSNAPGMTYPIKPVNTNFTDVLTAKVNSVKVAVTNTLGVSVVVSSVPKQWSAVSSSADGVRLAAAVNGGYIYTSTNSGVSWSATSAPNTNWIALASSADGNTLVALSGSGLLYDSSDFGITWVGTNIPPSTLNAGSVACSADGSEMVAAMYPGAIYTRQTATPGPALKISIVGNNVILNWPAGSTGFALQQKSDMFGSAAWTDAQITPIVTNGQNQATVPMTAGRYLYRLKKQ